MIPEIQSLSSLWILVGNSGQTKSSPGGGIAAVYTNKSGMAEVAVGGGGDVTGAGSATEEDVPGDAGTDDERLNLAWRPGPDSDSVVVLHV